MKPLHLLALTPFLSQSLLGGEAFIDSLSDDINAPTIFTIGSGGTIVTFADSVFESDLSTGGIGNSLGDIDFFNIVVENGFQLDSITLDLFGGGDQAFFGFGLDTLINNPAIPSQQAGFTSEALGFTLLDGSESSLFSELAAGAQGTLPGIGFDPTSALEAGTYSFVFQNTGGNVNDFGLTFTGSAVPEPSSFALLGLGSLALLRRRR